MQLWAPASMGKSGGKDGLVAEKFDRPPVLVKLEIWRCYVALLRCELARDNTIPANWDILQLAGIGKSPPAQTPGWGQLRWIAKVRVPAKNWHRSIMAAAALDKKPHPVHTSGFMPGMFCPDVIVVVSQAIQVARAWKLGLFISRQTSLPVST